MSASGMWNKSISAPSLVPAAAVADQGNQRLRFVVSCHPSPSLKSGRAEEYMCLLISNRMNCVIFVIVGACVCVFACVCVLDVNIGYHLW